MMDIKYPLLGVCIIALVLSLAYAIDRDTLANLSLSTDKANYTLGETVNISLSAPANISTSLVLSTPLGDLLSLLHNETGSFSTLYTPRETGNYTTTCEVLGLFATLEANFTVMEPLPGGVSGGNLTNGTEGAENNETWGIPSNLTAQNETIPSNETDEGPSNETGEIPSNETLEDEPSEASLYVEEREYAPGDEVIIQLYIPDGSNPSLTLVTPGGEALSLMLNETGVVWRRYTPYEAGDYNVFYRAPMIGVDLRARFTVKGANFSEAHESNLSNATEIIEEGEIPSNLLDIPSNGTTPPSFNITIHTDKVEYTLDEEVTLYLELPENLSCQLEIATPSGEALMLMLNLSGSFSTRYSPQEIGFYTATCGSLNLSTTFVVAGPEFLGEIKGIPRKLNYKSTEKPSFVFEFQALKGPKPPAAAVAEERKEARTLLFIDGMRVEHRMEVEELAPGVFNVTIPKVRQFRPGLYKLVLNITQDGETYSMEQDFLWGVLAINTHKSMYLPDEEAFIGIGVLDNWGHMVCNASVSLEITDPRGRRTILSTQDNSIHVSPECEFYGATTLPDYYTTYTVGGVGDYFMNLTAETHNGVRSITDGFEVRPRVDFDVSRDGPTRIYPPVRYTMTIGIKANEDYDGEVREHVPASFDITGQAGLSVEMSGDAKTLVWEVDLSKGDSIDLSYEFKAPFISPYLFLLGKLEIGDWGEVRYWQIASDAETVTWTFNPTLTGSQTPDGGTLYANVDASCAGTGKPSGCVGTMVLQAGGTTITDSCASGAGWAVSSRSYNVGSCNSLAASGTNGVSYDCGRDDAANVSFYLEACSAGVYTVSTSTTPSAGGVNEDSDSNVEATSVDDPPTISLNAPANDTNTSSSTVTFNCTPYDDINASNITLYGNWSDAGWHANETNSSAEEGVMDWFTKTTVPEGTWVWNCYVCDNATTPQCAFNDTNYTITVDTTTPALDWNWTDINSTTSYNSTTICVNASETVNCTLYFNGTTYVNSTTGTNICWNMTNKPNGNYSTINATCDDSASNHANTTNAWWNVSVQDTTPPVITWGAWVGKNATTSANSTTVTWTTDETVSNCTFYVNWSVGYYHNTTQGTSFSKNLTNIPNGNYTMNVTCRDMATNKGYSTNAWWNVSYAPPDVTPPSLDWNWTDINSTTSYNSTTICVNASETVNCTLYFNGTVYVNSTTGTNICWNQTNLPNGNYSVINATCDDTSGNHANTTNAWWNVSYVYTPPAIKVSINLSQTTVVANENVSVYGHINLTDGTNITNNTIWIHINETLLNGTNLENDTVHSPSWWNYNWTYRRKIVLTETEGNARTNEPVILTAEGLTITDCTKELRLINSSGDEIELEVLRKNLTPSQGSRWCKFTFKVNISASSEQTYYLYYGNTTNYAVDPNYNTLVYHYDDFETWDVGEDLDYVYSGYGNGRYDVWDEAWPTRANNVTTDGDNKVYWFGCNSDTTSCDSVWQKLALLEGYYGNMEDYTVDVMIKRLDNPSDDTGETGISFRNHDPGGTCYGVDEYMSWWDTDYTAHYLWKKYGDTGSCVDAQMASSTFSTTKGTWYNMRVTTIGDRHEAYADYGLEVEATDTNVESGTVLLFAWTQASSYFDNFTIWKGNVSLSAVKISTSVEDEEYYLETDSDGNYNYTFNAPTTLGEYVIKVNTTYGGSTGENSTNLTVIETTPPVITWNWGDQNSTTAYNSTTVGVTLDESGNCTLYHNLTGTKTRYVNTTVGTSITWNLTNVQNGNYTMNVTCEDVYGNQANSTNAWWNVSIGDTTPPTITWDWGDINSTTAYNSTTVGVTLNENGNCTLYHNLTGTKTRYVNTTVDTSITWNLTNFPDGNYTINVTCDDTSGNNANSTSAWWNVSYQPETDPPNVTIISPIADQIYCGNLFINASVNDTTGVSSVYYRISNSSGIYVIEWTAMSLGSGTSQIGYWNATYNTENLNLGNYNVTINATDTLGNSNNTERVEFDMPRNIVWNDNDSSGTDSINDTVTISNENVTVAFRFQDLNTGTASDNGYAIDTLTYKGEVILENTPYYNQNKLYADISKTNYLFGTTQIMGDLNSPDVFQALWSAAKAYSSQTYHNLYQDSSIISQGCVLKLSTASRAMPSYVTGSLTLGTQTNLTLGENNIVNVVDTIINKGGSTVDVTRAVTFPAPKLITSFFNEPENRNNNPYGPNYIRDIKPVAYSGNYTAYVTNYGSNSYGSGTLEIDDNTGDNPPWSPPPERALFIPALYVLNTTTSLTVDEKSTISFDLVINDTNISTYYNDYLTNNGITFSDFNYTKIRDHFTNRTRLNDSFHENGFVIAAYYSHQTTPPVGPSDWSNMILGKSLMTMFYDTGDDYYLNKTKTLNSYMITTLRHSVPSNWKYGYFMDATRPGCMIDWHKDVTAYMWSQPYQVQGLIAEYMCTKNQSVLEVIINNTNNVYNSTVPGSEGGLWNNTGYRWRWLIQDEGGQNIVDQDNYDAQIFGVNVMLQGYMLTHNESYLTRAQNVVNNYTYFFTRPTWIHEDTRKVNSFNLEMFTAKTLYLLYDITENDTYKQWANDLVDNVIYSAFYMDRFPDEYFWLQGGLGRMSHDFQNPSVPDSSGDSGLFAEYNLIPWMQEGLIAAYKHTGDEKYLNFSKQLLWHQMTSDARNQSVRMIDYFENSNVSWTTSDATSSLSFDSAEKKRDSNSLKWDFDQSGSETNQKYIYRTVSGPGNQGFADWDQFSNLTFWFYTTTPTKTMYLSLRNSGSWVLDKYDFSSQLSSGWTLVEVDISGLTRSSIDMINFTLLSSEFSSGAYTFRIDDLAIRRERGSNISSEYNAYTDLWYDYDNGQNIVGNLFAVTEIDTFLNGSRVEQSELLLMDRGDYLTLLNPFYNHTFNATLHLKRPFAHVWNKNTSTLINLSKDSGNISILPSDYMYILNATFILNETVNITKMLDESGTMVDDSVNIYINSSASLKTPTYLRISIASQVSSNITLNTTRFNMTFEPDTFSYTSNDRNFDIGTISQCGTPPCFTYTTDGSVWNVTIYNLTVEPGTEGNNISSQAADTTPPTITWGAWTGKNTTTSVNSTTVNWTTDETCNSCNLTVNGVVHTNNTAGISFSQNLTNFANGNWTMYVNCSDTSNNIGNSTDAWWNVSRNYTMHLSWTAWTGYNTTTSSNSTTIGLTSTNAAYCTLRRYSDNQEWANETSTTSPTWNQTNLPNANHTYYASCTATQYNLANTTLAWWNVSVPVTPSNELTDCANLDTANTEYTIIQDIVTDHTCFNITASNISLNAQSHTVTCSGCGTSNFYGVNASAGLTNVTVKNFADIDGFRRGMSFDRTNSSKISNNTMSSTMAETTYAIHMTDSDSVDVKNNTIEWNATGAGKYSHGVYLYVDSEITAGSNNISNNSLTIYSASSYAYGVYLYNSGTSNSNTIRDNTLDVNSSSSSAYGVQLNNNFGTSMNSNTIQDDSIDVTAGSTAYGVLLNNDGTSMNSNTVSNEKMNVTSTASASALRAFGVCAWHADFSNVSSCTVNATAPSALSAGIHLSSGSGSSHIWDNIVTGGNHSLYLASTGSDGSTFWNNTFQNAYDAEINDSSGAGDTNYFHYQNSHGIINWTSTAFRQDLSTKGTLELGNTINISNNSVSLSPTAFTSPYDLINSSANITLYEIDEWGFSNPVILRNGVECNTGTTPSCYNFTALNLATVKFNVSGWSNYSIGEGDVTAPNIDWNWTDINSTINVSSTTVCVNASERVNCTLHFAGVDYLNSSVRTNICWTVTGLSKGNYTPVNATCDDLGDNNANTTDAWVYVKPDMWDTFCGNVSGTLFLRNISIMQNWTWSGDGNIYAYQSDADISWGSLLALGRTTVGGAATDDFEEADTVLGTTNYVNNTNFTYSKDGSSPKDTQTFEVYMNPVYNVPIANSSNSSSYITGILWDSSDTVGDNEFDASDNENLVFVTKINPTASDGVCGDIDYEIRLPDTFDTYKGSSGTVTLLSELSIG